MSKVEKTDSCWIWKGGFTGDGYGAFYFNKKNTGSHRVSYILFKGDIQPGCLVRHTCDNPKCVNPEHLLLGSIKDNMTDKISRNRQVRGEGINTAKLTEDQIRQIRLKRAEGLTYASIAREFNVSSVNISDICKKKTWKHIV